MKYLIDKNTLKNIADAIRSKLGITSSIKAEDMATDISNIPTGIDTSDATATANDIAQNKTAYVNGEKITGTLGEIISNDFKDINASIYSNIQEYYETIEPIVPTTIDEAKSILKNTYTIPVKRDGTVLIDLSLITGNGMSLCAQNKYIKHIPSLNTSKITSFVTFFNRCTELISVDTLDTSSANNFNQVFDYDEKLVTIPVFNLSTLRGVPSNTFRGCKALSDESLNNILATCLTMTNLASTQLTNRKLTRLGLTEEQTTRCQSLSNYQAFINAGWTLI